MLAKELIQGDLVNKKSFKANDKKLNVLLIIALVALFAFLVVARYKKQQTQLRDQLEKTKTSNSLEENQLQNIQPPKTQEVEELFADNNSDYHSQASEVNEFIQQQEFIEQDETESQLQKSFEPILTNEKNESIKENEEGGGKFEKIDEEEQNGIVLSTLKITEEPKEEYEVENDQSEEIVEFEYVHSNQIIRDNLTNEEQVVLANYYLEILTHYLFCVFLIIEGYDENLAIGFVLKKIDAISKHTKESINIDWKDSEKQQISVFADFDRCRTDIIHRIRGLQFDNCDFLYEDGVLSLKLSKRYKKSLKNIRTWMMFYLKSLLKYLSYYSWIRF